MFPLIDRRPADDLLLLKCTTKTTLQREQSPIDFCCQTKSSRQRSLSQLLLFFGKRMFLFISAKRVPETKSSIRIFLPKSLSFSSPSTRPLILVDWKAIFESRRGDSLGLGARFGQKTALSFIDLACVWTTKIPFEKVTMCGPPSLQGNNFIMYYFVYFFLFLAEHFRQSTKTII